MSSVLKTVDERTRLVGENRLELLLFTLQNGQTYGINVFKVREVMPCPKLTQLPYAHQMVRGVAHLRGTTLAVIDLNHAIGQGAHAQVDKGFVIITEYNRTVQGFLVNSVERIVNLNWQSVVPPPIGCGESNYLTAVTQLQERIVEILDVEKILIMINPNLLEQDAQHQLSAEVIDDITQHHLRILVADDSTVARQQIKRCAESLGLEVVLMPDGEAALTHLKNLVAEGHDIKAHYLMLISDIEMPKMDGYTLTAEIRKDALLKDMDILLHTSLSGCFNQSMVQKAGANAFMAKFQREDMVEMLTQKIQQRLSADRQASA
jgi:two-component system chemotaxis response regulator CheV